MVKPFVRRPLGPSEHATVARDAPASSYMLSHETESHFPTTARERMARTALKVNCISAKDGDKEVLDVEKCEEEEDYRRLDG